MARPGCRRVRHELGGRPGRELGAADRRPAVPAHGRRPAGARTAADAALDAGALEATGVIAGYCAALALLAAGRDGEAAPVADRIVAEGLEPASVGEALAAIARGDDDGLATARREVLRSFEERDAFLEDVPVADTVLVLDALARERGLRLEPLPSVAPALGLAPRQLLGARHRGLDRIEERGADARRLELADRRDRRPAR